MKDFLNFMRAAEESVKKDAEAPAVICFCKEPGFMGKISITLKGPESVMFAGLCQLVPEAIKKAPKEMQKDILEMLYTETLHELVFGEETLEGRTVDGLL